MDEGTLTDAGLLIGLCQYEQAERLLEDLVAVAKERGDDQLASHALEGLGTIATRQGREARALELFERALAAAGEADPVERETLYIHTARLRAYGGDPGGAVRLWQAASPEEVNADLAEESARPASPPGKPRIPGKENP